MRTKGEILAPVGGPEQLIAAVRCGADAVYLGTKGFNARRNATNFEGQSLAETVGYCHARDVKVFVTVNTLVKDRELHDLEETAHEIAASGADAVILQDMAALRLFMNRYPSIRRYASTQTAVHNLAGARRLQDMGYERIVLAREMSAREMEKVVEGIDVETEAFIHGALCMSVSGACGLSCILGGRSGNRGLCAQPCRLNFRSPHREYALSLKDMSSIDHIREWSDMGITSFKIEGRMKRPEYVAASVTACRLALEGKPYDLETLRAVFSRGGFTDGYTTGHRDARQFGIRSEADAKASPTVFGTLAGLYRTEYSHIPVDMKLTVDADTPSTLELSCGDERIVVEGPAGQPAKTQGTGQEQAERSLGKTGGTPFVPGKIVLDNPSDLFLSGGDMNALRRQALDQLLEKRHRVMPHLREDWSYPELCAADAPSVMPLRARFASLDQISCEDGYEKITLPLREVEKAPELIASLGEKLVVELPAVAYPSVEDKIFSRLQKMVDLGIRAVYTENIYGIEWADQLGLSCHGGCGLNILNAQSADVYREMGLKDSLLSWEISMRQVEEFASSMPFGLRIYGCLPLMRLRTCPMQGKNGCGNCHGGGELEDRKGVMFPVSCDERQYSTLYNSVPLHLGDRRIAPVHFGELYFTQESREECERVLEEIQCARVGEKPHTSGMYFRTLL